MARTTGDTVVRLDLIKTFLETTLAPTILEYFAQEGGISRWGWAQNSVSDDRHVAKTYKYNYEYYLFKASEPFC